MGDMGFSKINPSHRVNAFREHPEEEKGGKKKEEQKKGEPQKKEELKDDFVESKEEEKAPPETPGNTVDWVQLQNIKQQPAKKEDVESGWDEATKKEPPKDISKDA